MDGRKPVKRGGRKPQQKPPSANTAIERFLEQLDKAFQANQNNPNPPFPYDKDTNTIQLPKNIEQGLFSLLEQGRKVEAVKRVTQLTGAGLRVSKDYVDNLTQKH
jgi:ribosomal protein L7/L12